MFEVMAPAGLAFVRRLVGIILRPYEAYRKIVERGKPAELIYIGFLLVCYFALAAIVKTASFRPFLLTREFVALFGASGFAYLVIVGLLWRVGKWFGSRGKLTEVAVAWGYTLVPTWTWFLATSILYVLIPPPRTTSAAGITFSVLYLVFSITLLFWKIMLGYLTLRFALRLSLGKIIGVATVVVPLVALLSWWMYWMGVFKVPFI